MSNKLNFPLCGVVECFGNNDGYCVVLSDNEFGNRECPFFKTKEQVKEEKAYCEKRLAEIKK